MYQTDLPMRLLLVLLILFCNTNLQAQDYFKYHEGIIKAEEQIFVKQQYDEGLKTYADIFKKYDFVFAHDCVMAMQIALFRNNEKLFLQFTTKAMQNGLTIKHFDSRMMVYFQKHPIYNQYKDSIASIYRLNRPHYLKRIDTVALGKMTQLFSNDQLEKNGLPTLTMKNNERRYLPQITETMNQLLKLIAERGYPSDRLIGIDCQNLLRELGTTRMTPLDYYKKYKGDPCCSIGQSQFEFDEYTLSSGMIMPVIIHHGNVVKDRFDKRKYLSYPDSFYIRQIKNGYMHPKDLAFLYDYGFNNGGTFTGTVNTNNGEKFFDVGIKGGAVRTINITDAEINKIRKAFYIAPIENDRIKISFMQKHGMFIGWGWAGTRS